MPDRRTESLNLLSARHAAHQRNDDDRALNRTNTRRSARRFASAAPPVFTSSPRAGRLGRADGRHGRAGVPPVATLLPLLALAATFEAVFALHVGVERIGRYLQVFHERPLGARRPARWEHAAWRSAGRAGAATIDALFTVPFLLAALFNLVPAALAAPDRQELVFVGGAHALFGCASSSRASGRHDSGRSISSGFGS